MSVVDAPKNLIVTVPAPMKMYGIATPRVRHQPNNVKAETWRWIADNDGRLLTFTTEEQALAHIKARFPDYWTLSIIPFTGVIE